MLTGKWRAASPVCWSISSSVLPSLINKTQTYLNSNTRGHQETKLWEGHLIVKAFNLNAEGSRGFVITAYGMMPCSIAKGDRERYCMGFLFFLCQFDSLCRRDILISWRLWWAFSLSPCLRHDGLKGGCGHLTVNWFPSADTLPQRPFGHWSVSPGSKIRRL